MMLTNILSQNLESGIGWRGIRCPAFVPLCWPTFNGQVRQAAALKVEGVLDITHQRGTLEGVAGHSRGQLLGLQ